MNSIALSLAWDTIPYEVKTIRSLYHFLDLVGFVQKNPFAFLEVLLFSRQKDP